jgi:methylphosphotriester-DNA--protein-cysteine methyltransferase
MGIENNQLEQSLEQNLNLPEDGEENQPALEGGEQKPAAGGEQHTDPEQPPVEQAEEESNKEPSWEEKHQALEVNYQRLERKFTRISQELSEAREAASVLNWISERPELAGQVQELMENYQNDPQHQSQLMDIDIGQVQKEAADAWRFLLGKQDFVQHEQDIAEFAEEEGYDPNDPLQLKEAYRLWRGENADRLAQEQALKMQQRGTQKQEARKKAGLQGSGGPGGTPPNYKKMSAEEVLAHEGLSLYTDD